MLLIFCCTLLPQCSCNVRVTTFNAALSRGCLWIYYRWGFKFVVIYFHFVYYEVVFGLFIVLLPWFPTLQILKRFHGAFALLIKKLCTGISLLISFDMVEELSSPLNKFLVLNRYRAQLFSNLVFAAIHRYLIDAPNERLQKIYSLHHISIFIVNLGFLSFYIQIESVNRGRTLLGS